MTHLDDMFSLFISVIMMGMENGNISGGILAAVEDVGDRAGFHVGLTRAVERADGTVSWVERIVFDIQTETILLKDCDIVVYRDNALALVNVAMPQHALLLEQVRDCGRKEGLIWNIVVALFASARTMAAKIAVEDSFSLAGLDVFSPGDWNAFRNGRVPDFLSLVTPHVTSEDASFYTREQICALGVSEKEMGLSLMRTIGLKRAVQ